MVIGYSYMMWPSTSAKKQTKESPSECILATDDKMELHSEPTLVSTGYVFYGNYWTDTHLWLWLYYVMVKLSYIMLSYSYVKSSYVILCYVNYMS